MRPGAGGHPKEAGCPVSEHNDRYGWRHRRERARWQRDVERGLVSCARCKQPIHPLEPWDLDHRDGEGPQVYIGPSHRRCNRATAGRGVAAPVKPEWRRWWSQHWAEPYPDTYCPCDACRDRVPPNERTEMRSER